MFPKNIEVVHEEDTAGESSGEKDRECGVMIEPRVARDKKRAEPR